MLDVDCTSLQWNPGLGRDSTACSCARSAGRLLCQSAMCSSGWTWRIHLTDGKDSSQTVILKALIQDHFFKEFMAARKICQNCWNMGIIESTSSVQVKAVLMKLNLEMGHQTFEAECLHSPPPATQTKRWRERKCTFISRLFSALVSRQIKMTVAVSAHKAFIQVQVSGTGRMHGF